MQGSGLIVNREPNWLKKAPNTIDIFNIDYNSNEYIRRYINSVIQYFLRKTNEDQIRIVVIDEVHLLLLENSVTIYLIKQLLREARKFNLSVIFVSQNINDIPEDIRGQFQNQFMFRQTDLEMTAFYPDKVCNVSLYDSKLDFSMNVADIF